MAPAERRDRVAGPHELGRGASTRFLQAADALLVITNESCHVVAYGIEVEVSGPQHRLDVSPVLGAVEHHLEHGELDRPENGDLRALERHRTPIPAGHVVKRLMA